VSVLLVELDLEFPRARHRQRRLRRTQSASTAADAARHEQHCVSTECFRCAQGGLALGERPIHLALVATVELGPSVQHRMNAHPELVGDCTHLRRFFRRNIAAAFRALEPGILHPLQLIFGGSGDQRLVQFRFERQRRCRSS
jgi:hypothetical protein